MYCTCGYLYGLSREHHILTVMETFIPLLATNDMLQPGCVFHYSLPGF